MLKLIYINNKGQIVAEFGFTKYITARVQFAKENDFDIYAVRKLPFSWYNFKLCWRKAKFMQTV